ncbi:MAG: ATP-NAD kinase family protein [Cytophagales bacterium]|nr:ATP-NAD kinase family protein [Cytophagales bacterium]
MKTIGLIVNPIAGMGGAVGLKGTDTALILNKAKKLGASPGSTEKAKIALKELLKSKAGVKLMTCPDSMGASVAKELGVDFELVDISVNVRTTAQNTMDAAREMLRKNIDLLLFAGGDGTARDICESVGTKLPALGIPTGVKIHSSTFSINPTMAGRLCASFIEDKKVDWRTGEVIDLDEQQYRLGNISSKLYGYLRIPYLRAHVQKLKSGSPESEKYGQEAIAQYMMEKMEDEIVYFIGPGSTTMALTDKLGLRGSLLGVDIITKSKVLKRDVTDRQLLDFMNEGRRVEVIVTPIGGQGFLFGRGNQQFAPKVLCRFEPGQIHILSTQKKIIDLQGQPLLIDSGDESVNKQLTGYYRIISGYHESLVYKAVG